MARFGDPSHNQHKLAGMRKALASPNTPAHLKPHIQKALTGAPMAFDSMDTTGASAGSIGRSVDPNAGNYGRGPMQNVPQTVKPPKTAKVKNARTGMKKQKKNLLFGS